MPACVTVTFGPLTVAATAVGAAVATVAAATVSVVTASAAARPPRTSLVIIRSIMAEPGDHREAFLESEF
nr:hypothetical protein KPHV_70600 [Kitasatospora purpeofusca]